MAAIDWILKVEKTITDMYTGPDGVRQIEIDGELSDFLRTVQHRHKEEILTFNSKGRQILRKAKAICSL